MSENEDREMVPSLQWKAMIEAEHAQSHSARGEAPPQDHWQPYARNFVADPRRTDDPLLERLLRDVAPHHTVIDVGAGAGRLALPIALRCQHVVAVEPSSSMASILLQQAAEHDIHNISVVESTWEDAEVDAGHVVLCAHVLYTSREIEAFVRKLDAQARERVIVVLYDAPPQSQNYSIWKRVHGEERLPLPSLPEFREVLRELGIAAQLDEMPSNPTRSFETPAQAVEQLAGRLYLTPGSQKHRLLEEVLPDMLEEATGRFRIRGERPLTPALVRWQPKH